jgi:hypothetical protein
MSMERGVACVFHTTAFSYTEAKRGVFVEWELYMKEREGMKEREMMLLSHETREDLNYRHP